MTGSSPIEIRSSLLSVGSASNQVEAEIVKQAWRSEPGNTMFAIINAYTRSAQEPGMAAEEAYRLEKIGGRILSMVKQ